MNPPNPNEHFQDQLQPLLLQAFDQLSSACFVTEASGRIVWANQAFCRLSGYELDELAGRTPALLNAGLEAPAFYAGLWQQILSGRVWRGSVIDKRKDGTLYVTEEVITPLRAQDGSVSYFVAVQHDLTGLAADDIRQGRPGALTGFSARPSRAACVERLDKLITAAMRTTELLGVLRIDVDDERGSDALTGTSDDEGAAAIAQRFRHVIRRPDVLAALGRREFAILLGDVKDATNVLHIVERLELALGRPFLLRGKTLALRGNIGVALFPRDGTGADALLANAGHALYQASLQGANRAQFYQRSFAYRIADSLPTTHTVQ